MKFEYNDYYKVLVIASIVVMTFSLVGLLINLFLLIKNNGYIKFDKRIIRYLVSIILLAFLFSLGAVPFKHGRHLFIEKEEDKVVAFGEIDCFKNGLLSPVLKPSNTFPLGTNKVPAILYSPDGKITLSHSSVGRSPKIAASYCASATV